MRWLLVLGTRIWPADCDEFLWLRVRSSPDRQRRDSKALHGTEWVMRMPFLGRTEVIIKWEPEPRRM